MPDMKNPEKPDLEQLTADMMEKLKRTSEEALRGLRLCVKAADELPKNTDDLFTKSLVAAVNEFDINNNRGVVRNISIRLFDVNMDIPMIDRQYGEPVKLPNGSYRALLFIIPVPK